MQHFMNNVIILSIFVVNMLYLTMTTHKNIMDTLEEVRNINYDMQHEMQHETQHEMQHEIKNVKEEILKLRSEFLHEIEQIKCANITKNIDSLSYKDPYAD